MKVSRKTGPGDGDKPPMKSKPSPEQIAAANAFAKQLGRRLGFKGAEDFHVGDSIPRFVDEKGNDITGKPQVSNIKVETVIPPYVKELQWDAENNLPYYTDEKTGYIKYVDKSFMNSSRFKKPIPVTETSILDYAKKL